MKNQTTNAVSTPATTTTIEVKTFESGRFSLKLNGKKVALKTFSFDNGFYSFPADTEIIFNGRKLRYIGTFREFFDTEYLFADENGNGVRNDECASLIWGLAKFGTHDVNRQIAQVANDKKAYFVRAKIESEQHAIDAERTFCRGKIKMIDSNVFNLLPDFADEDDDDELIDEPTAEIEQTTGTVATETKVSEEPEITKAEKITAVIADAKDFIATNLDARTEKVFKLCFGIHASIHFYLNNLKGKLFSELHAIEDEMSKFKGTAMKFYDAYLAASDGYLDSEEMTALYYHICYCVAGGYSTAVYDQTRNIAKEILDKLGEETLMREIAKVTDEFGISRDLLNQSDSCEFKPFNLDTAHDTPAEISEEPEITKAEKITDELAAALKDMYIADTFATPDENDNVPIIPAVDFFAFAALLYLTDICTTAYRKNPDGTFTEDEEAYKRLHEVEMKFFDEMPDTPDTPDTAPDTPGESICKVAEHLNANAPEGWAVIRDKEKLRVEYQGKFVAAAERVTDRDLIVPQAFFRQFEPLIDKSKTPAQIFLDDRYRELAELEKMRKSPDCTPAAIKTLDEMINRLKRDIADAELSPADTIESYCKAGAVDEHGVIWF